MMAEMSEIMLTVNVGFTLWNDPLIVLMTGLPMRLLIPKAALPLVIKPGIVLAATGRVS